MRQKAGKLRARDQQQSKQEGWKMRAINAVKMPDTANKGEFAKKKKKKKRMSERSDIAQVVIRTAGVSIIDLLAD